MIEPISPVHYAYEEQANGKVKLYMARIGDPWKLIPSDSRRHFLNAVNDLVDSRPACVDLMDVWKTLDYNLPPTPWDWMDEDEA